MSGARPAYASLAHLVFGGGPPTESAEEAAAVILPAPLDRTTSYLAGTRAGPREILLASTQIETWDEEIGVDVHAAGGVWTLPEMELPYVDVARALDEIERVASWAFGRGAFLVTLGGEHALTPAVVRAAAAEHPTLSVLQIDAHADLRDSYQGSPNSHACAMRRVLEVAPCVQVGIRSISEPEARDAPSLRTRLFHDATMRDDAEWMTAVVESLGDPVYVTIDCDGLEPSLMPAVGTPEPGGLSWRETLSLLSATFRRRRVIGCDVVELCPLPGLVAPNVIAARLVSKLLAYRTLQ